MSSKSRKWAIGFGAFFGVLLLLVIFIMFFFDWNLLKGVIESKVSSSTGRTIKINGDIDIKFDGLKPLITINGADISNMATGTAPKMLTADKIGVRFDLLSIFHDRLNFPYINVENGNILLEKDKDGNANWLFGEKDKKSDSPSPRFGALLIKNTKLAYKDPTQNTDLAVVANSSGDFRSVDGDAGRQDFINIQGDGKYKNNPFGLDLTGASVLDLQDKKQPYPVKTTVKVGTTTIHAEGSVLDPAALEGLDITLSVKGSNAADIFPIVGIALPPTPPYSVTGKLDFTNGVWKFNDFKGTMGSSDISGNLSWDKNHERPLLTANFVSNKLDFKDLGGLIGAPPAKKDAAKLNDEQKQKIAKKDASPYIIPDAPLDISRLKAMDAKVEFTGKQVISSSLPLDDFYLKLDLDNLLLKIEPVKFGTAGGDISANLTVNARQEPVQIDSDFQFKKLALSRLFEKMPVGNKGYNKGYIGGVAKLKGTGKSLRQMLSTSDGNIGIGMEGGELSNVIVELIGLDVAESLKFLVIGDKPIRMNCVIGDFKVNKGVMNSQVLVIDTSDTNIKGNGTINLSNEKMKIELMPHPKDKSILSFKSPILIGGTLKNPDVGIGAESLIAKGAVGAVASVLLTPFVGALVFVEPGLGKDSDCAKLIHDMKVDTGGGKAGLIPKNKDYKDTKDIKKPKKPENKQKINHSDLKTPSLPGTVDFKLY